MVITKRSQPKKVEKSPLLDFTIITVCPRSSDPFYIVSYYKNGSLLLGHTVISVIYIFFIPRIQ